jgi:Hemerythrin HHE cation binding domain
MSISFFRRKPRESPAANDAPVEAAIPYDPQLVDALILGHRELLLLLDKAKGSAQAKRLDDVKAMLDQLRTGLAAHMKRETEELHPYLTSHIKSDDRLATLKDMHAGALRTSRALEGFLKHYGGYPVTERNTTTFYNEIDGVHREFKKWLEQEEAFVYTLYKSPESYG